MTALAHSAPELAFAIRDGGVLDHSAVPTLRFGVGVERVDGGAVRALSLTVQVRIAATRRGYGADDQIRLAEVFGAPADWGRSLHSLLWARVSVNVPPFTGATVVDLHLPCTYDFEVAAAKYLDGLRDGEVPLEFLFSGTLFHAGAHGALQVAQVPWDREATFRLPVSAYREAMDRHFPGAAWLRLERETFDRLYAYRARHTLLSWEATLDALLRESS